MSGLPAWPFFDSEQIAAACSVLSSGAVNYWTGSQTSAFESEFSSWSSISHSIAVANGSLAELGVHPSGHFLNFA